MRDQIRTGTTVASFTSHAHANHRRGQGSAGKSFLSGYKTYNRSSYVYEADMNS